ncbi:NINE protein [Ellagibacter isourolithinifaciens]|uniref:NINE protein n=1 Tax=Ellagibacter isourolithinifaciens TaxID=2137581 RepID=UPI003FD724F5
MSDSNNMNDEIAAAEAALKEAQERLRVAREKQAQGGQPEESGEIGGANQPGEADQPGSADQSNQQGHDAWSQAYQQGHDAWSQPSQQASDVWGQTYQQANGQAYQQSQGPWQANQAYSQPYGQPYQQPYAQAAPNTKDHVAAGLLAIFLGSLGIHKFYLGYNTPGFIMLAVTIVGSIFSLGLAGLAMVVISIVEGVLYLSKSQTEFEQIYVFNKKEWF